MKAQDEKKAKEIALSTFFYWTNDEVGDDITINKDSFRTALQNAVIQAIQWKKQQMIGELKKWLDESPPIKNTWVCEFYVSSLLKAMEGE